MKNIVFISNSISFGGASKMLCFVAESLAKRNYNVSIVNLKATKNVTDFERSLDNNIKLYVPIKPVKNKNIHYVKQIAKFAKEQKADIIIGFTERPNLYAKIVGDILKIPSIMSERGDPKRTNVGVGLKNKIVLNVINRSKGGVFQTEGAKAFYGRGLQQRGCIIPNPIFIDGEIPQISYSEREKTVVSVGRLDNEQKRYDIMLKGFALFHKTHPEYILKLYGKGLDEDKIETWAEELEIRESVKFMGLTTKPMQDIAKDGIFLITSDFEGISNALLEAMAVGLPCVSTDCSPGGARLLIQNKENGIIVPIEDTNAIGKALYEFAENPKLAEECGIKAKDVIDRFDPEGIIDMWEDYINKLI